MRPPILISFFIFFSICCFCQKGAVHGYILDEQSRSPLAGVTISIAGHPSGDNSDNFGIFHLDGLKPGPHEIILSHVDYDEKKIPVMITDTNPAVVRASMQRSGLTLSAITVSTRKNPTFNTIAPVDIKLRPVNTSQDILRAVSGLFIAQHTGGGKAEQIFLRGYDIDHGTDINITVDGLPVNMVSHAHGQGYADLHFLIPETVEKVNFDKGPYFANKGNLATAGFVEMQTKDFLEGNLVKLQAGRFNTQRLLGMFKLLNKENIIARQQLYVASEYFKSNGHFESPQHFHRFNTLVKYNAVFNNAAQLTVLASTLDSKWDASGQIPERAVKDGRIGKFGAIDDSEGGNTNRTNASIKFSKRWKSGWQTSDQLYFTNYHFNLYSNFTFFLNDPVNGDEINQRETRTIYGYTGTISREYVIGNRNASTSSGWGFRYDLINNIELSHVIKRRFLENIQNGDIREWNGFVYTNQHIELTSRISLNAGLRYDRFSFSYKNILTGETGFRKQHRGIISPKLNLTYQPGPAVKMYVNTGMGFHSNDTRVILNNDAKDILPRVLGADIGIVTKPSKRFLLKTALWHLYSEQEFVYVGDEGIVEAGGKTRRIGIDVSARYELYHWLFADIDFNYARPRAIHSAKGQDYVPLAPRFTSIGGLTIQSKKGFNASLRYRYIGDRPANENNAVTADGYFLLDATVNYIHNKLEFSISMENILNRYWKEAQFDTESRLQAEPMPVSEIHYTPGTPRFFKIGIGFNF